MTTFHTRKIFPRRLPESYHGDVEKPSLAQLLKNRMSDRPVGNPQQLTPSKKISTWQKKRFDEDIKRERRQMVVHPAKISEQNPDWLKSTYDNFRRAANPPRHRQTRAQWESYDVFGRHKIISYAQNPYPKHRFSQNLQVTPKVGNDNRFRSTSFKEVTPKVGSVDVRDLTIYRPQMKVGKTDFINTYSPF